jgi:alkylhydroperoxidase/carboxymuconolactone decarboxylase family protein YurZ
MRRRCGVAILSAPREMERHMDEQTEDPVAIGASVAANCAPCTKHHLAKYDELSVARGEVRAAVEVGQMVHGGAASNTRKFVDELLGAEAQVLAN